VNPQSSIDSNNDAAGSLQTTPIVWIVLFETSRQFISQSLDAIVSASDQVLTLSSRTTNPR
jgi:hypothetical protein